MLDVDPTFVSVFEVFVVKEVKDPIVDPVVMFGLMVDIVITVLPL